MYYLERLQHKTKNMQLKRTRKLSTAVHRAWWRRKCTAHHQQGSLMHTQTVLLLGRFKQYSSLVLSGTKSSRDNIRITTWTAVREKVTLLNPETTHAYVRVCVCVCVSVYVRMYICMIVCNHVCKYVCKYAYIHPSIHPSIHQSIRLYILVKKKTFHKTFACRYTVFIVVLLSRGHYLRRGNACAYTFLSLFSCFLSCFLSFFLALFVSFFRQFLYYPTF